MCLNKDEFHFSTFKGLVRHIEFKAALKMEVRLQIFTAKINENVGSPNSSSNNKIV